MNRRARGEGTIYPVRNKEGEIIRWATSITIGWENGKRQRKKIERKTEALVAEELTRLKALYSRDADPTKKIALFWSRIDRSGGEDVCWPWTGGRTNNKQGFRYGIFRFNGRICRSHRLAFELTCGPIPDGLFACHRCDNPICCNPKHLFLGTAKDNAQDMIAKGRGASPPLRSRAQ